MVNISISHTILLSYGLFSDYLNTFRCLLPVSLVGSFASLLVSLLSWSPRDQENRAHSFSFHQHRKTSKKITCWYPGLHRFIYWNQQYLIRIRIQLLLSNLQYRSIDISGLTGGLRTTRWLSAQLLCLHMIRYWFCTLRMFANALVHLFIGNYQRKIAAFLQARHRLTR